VLVQGSNGNFYGTNGTVFEITPSGTLTVLFTFTGRGNDQNPADPMSGFRSLRASAVAPEPVKYTVAPRDRRWTSLRGSLTTGFLDLRARISQHLFTRSHMFSRHAFQARFDVLGLGRAFLESLVFTLWVIIPQLRSPSL
jgi:hypothetical protein